MMKDLIILVILGIMILGSVLYIKRSKKKGCIGCPYASQCGGGCLEQKNKQK